VCVPEDRDLRNLGNPRTDEEGPQNYQPAVSSNHRLSTVASWSGFPDPLLALATGERAPDPALTARIGGDPFTHLPGRLMPHMLRMAAVENGDPVAEVVLPKANDRSIH
jgi:hypothetical protein